MKFKESTAIVWLIVRGRSKVLAHSQKAIRPNCRGLRNIKHFGEKNIIQYSVYKQREQ